MIDISIYQFKLELLRQYVFAKIDGHVPKFEGATVKEIHLWPYPALTPDEIIRAYNETGIMFWSDKKYNGRDVTFDEYCEYKLYEPINMW